MTEYTKLSSRCPLRFDRYIDQRDEACREDCAWLIVDTNGNKACAITCLAAKGNCFVANPLIANKEEG